MPPGPPSGRCQLVDPLLDPLGALRQPPNPMPLKKKIHAPPPNQNSWIRPCVTCKLFNYRAVNYQWRIQAFQNRGGGDPGAVVFCGSGTGTCFIHGPPLLIKQDFISKGGPCMKQVPVGSGVYFELPSHTPDLL